MLTEAQCNSIINRKKGQLHRTTPSSKLKQGTRKVGTPGTPKTPSNRSTSKDVTSSPAKSWDVDDLEGKLQQEIGFAFWY